MLEANCNNNNTLDANVGIVQRLEKLNKWQKRQKRLLDEHQNMQRKMLGMDHQNMYEVLGLLKASDVSVTETDGGGDEINDELRKVANEDDAELDSKITAMESRLFENGNKAQVQNLYRTNYNNECSKGEVIEIQQVCPKRPYLKRGEGIKKRFRIEPDSLRLNNLPRYKYGTHSKLKNGQRRKLTPRAKSSQESTIESVDQLMQIEKFERQCQQIRTNSKPNCSSAPEVNLSTITLPKIHFGEKSRDINAYEESQQEQQLEPYAGITWSKVLDSQQVKPISIQEIRATTSNPDIPNCKNHVEEDEQLSIFELLEQQAAKGSIDMNSSCIRKFLDHKISNVGEQNEEIEIPIDKRYAAAGLRPAVEEILKDDSDDNSFNSDDRETHSTGYQTPRISTYLGNETINDSTSNADKAELHVRFVEDNMTCEYDNPDYITSESSILPDEETTSNKSSDLFHQFKDALFKALLSQTDGENNDTEQKVQSLPSPLTQELQEKSNIIKGRLEELEKEIIAFRNNNIELTRAKQEYEMERAHFTEECNEAMDRLKDDKIQMEMYLHDERMKLEEDKRKYETQIRVQKMALTNKERKEIAQLKDEVEMLNLQLKQKEQSHASAQARLRVQIRNLERDQKQLHEDIERLTKENKRLQSEKQKLERDGNNKMLIEINRNIAKLAPKLAADNHNNVKAKSTYPPPVVSKQNNKVSHFMKAPPNTRSCSRTDLVTDVESVCTVPQLEINNCINASDADLEDGDDDDDDDDDELIPDIKIIHKLPKNKSGSKNAIVSPVHKSETAKIVQDETNVVSDSAIGCFSSKEKTNGKSTNESPESFRRQIINADGSRDIWYPNGNLKKISADGMNIRMLYFNKDIKETNVNEGTVKYYYAETNTWHTTYLDGLEILEFPNGQTEHRHKNGVVEIHFPDNSVKTTNPAEKDKLEEWRFADGTNLIQMRNGDRVLVLPNGQKEIHTKHNKRREYPDGTVKLVYPDGSQETRYSNGRIRLKDKDGNLVLDTESA